MVFTGYNSIARKVNFVKNSHVDYFDESFSIFGLNVYRLRIKNRAKPKKTIERVVQVVDENPKPSTVVEKKFRLFHHNCDYIKSNCDGTFYWTQDKSGAYSKMRLGQEIREGDVLGYLDHFDGLYGNITTEVISTLNGYILRPKIKNEQKVVRGDKLFLIYVKNPKKPKKPKKSTKNKT